MNAPARWLNTMSLTPEHKAARGAIMKTLAALLIVVIALYVGSFFFLSD